MARKLVFKLDNSRAIYGYSEEDFQSSLGKVREFISETWKSGDCNLEVCRIGELHLHGFSLVSVDGELSGLVVEDEAGSVVGSISWEGDLSSVAHGREIVRYYPAGEPYNGEKFTLPRVAA